MLRAAPRRAESFAHDLTVATTHSGDSDSTGAIACNLLGLIFPGEVLAHDWRRQIECADLIDRIARDLYQTHRPGGDFGEKLWEFYPGF